jgi:hypothetical protein
VHSTLPEGIMVVHEMMAVLLSQNGREAGHLGAKGHRSRGLGHSGLRSREVGKAKTSVASWVVYYIGQRT